MRRVFTVSVEDHYISVLVYLKHITSGKTLPYSCHGDRVSLFQAGHTFVFCSETGHLKTFSNSLALSWTVHLLVIHGTAVFDTSSEYYLMEKLRRPVTSRSAAL